MGGNPEASALRAPPGKQPHLPALGIGDAVPGNVEQFSLQQDAISPEDERE